jgi:GGDEF domain-containing protein
VRGSEALCAVIRGTPFSLLTGPSVPITTTIGVACCPPHGPTADDVQRAADWALMEAKKADERGTWDLARVMPTVIRGPKREPPTRGAPSRIVP